ncbi:hypothetical protein ACBY01_11815 [Sphingomonas sp. ac-8]|uniref:hypothetical protein n=1 Tax=Sphingomonas sp. ac-8 TaxID=3242977 RepID=UPI003A80DCD3
MAYIPKDTPLARERRARRLAKREAVLRDIWENPIRAQLVYAASGEPLGTVTPHDDGTWSGSRYGPGYPGNTIKDVTEEAAIAYVANNEELGDGPAPAPWEEAFGEQEEEDAATRSNRRRRS